MNKIKKNNKLRYEMKQNHQLMVQQNLLNIHI